MREINTHKVNGCNEAITIAAVDEPGSGGANHHYSLEFTYSTGFPSIQAIRFQNGAIKEVGVNGLTNEVLLAIVADRLKGFQKGPYACEPNKCALELVQNAMSTLQERTKERTARGVEGTLQV